MIQFTRTNNVLNDFRYCGNIAGSVSDWNEAKEWINETMSLYNEYRGLRSEMRVIAQEFLWIVEFERERQKI